MINEHLIWGAGTMGGIIAAYWTRAGLSVTCVDNNKDHVEAIRKNGLQVVGPIEEFTQKIDIIHVDELSSRLSENEKIKKVYLATKAQHTPGAVRQIEPFLADDGFVMSWQNGLNELEIGSVVGTKRTLGAFFNFSGDILESGKINFGGRGATVIGEVNGEITERISGIHRNMLIFNKDSILTDNIYGYLWSKNAYGAMLFAEAVTPRGITEMFETEKWHRFLFELGREVVEVATAEKISLKPFNGFNPSSFSKKSSFAEGVKSLLALAEHNRPHTKTHSGVWRDLAVHKRKTEVDMIMGAVLPVAEKHNIDIPLIKGVVEAVHKIENGLDVQGDHHLDNLANIFTA